MRVVRHHEDRLVVLAVQSLQQLQDLARRLRVELARRLVEQRDGRIGKSSDETVAFFIPRRNIFLGEALIHAGVYPDGVIRLIKRGKAKFPAKSVHELMEINGRVAWLFNDLEHHDSPTIKRYIERANRYTDLTAAEFKDKHTPINVFYLLIYSLVKPLFVFLKLYIRHRGYLDGIRGFIWSLFSALHFPIAYFKYWLIVKKNTHPSKLVRSGNILVV